VAPLPQMQSNTIWQQLCQKQKTYNNSMLYRIWVFGGQKMHNNYARVPGMSAH
jgi:hypothetical protein